MEQFLTHSIIWTHRQWGNFRLFSLVFPSVRWDPLHCISIDYSYFGFPLCQLCDWVISTALEGFPYNKESSYNHRERVWYAKHFLSITCIHLSFSWSQSCLLRYHLLPFNLHCHSSHMTHNPDVSPYSESLFRSPWHMTFMHVLLVPCVWLTLKLYECINTWCNVSHSSVNLSCNLLTQWFPLLFTIQVENQITFLSNASYHSLASFLLQTIYQGSDVIETI